jgi:peptidoglycan/LPS O-acetylase OafA/YrhL
VTSLETTPSSLSHQGTESEISAPRLGLGRLAGLDGIRGLAVLLVVLSHMVSRTVGMLPAIGLSTGIRHAVDGGYLGVDVFFVLSGFLITSLLLDEQRQRGRVRFRAFYARRALRLLPALYVMLAAQILYTLIARQPVVTTLQTALGAVLYVTNWQGVYHSTTIAKPLGHLWSLSVEEQFYLVWPVVLIACFGLNRRVRIVIPAFIALIDIVIVQRIGLWQIHGWLQPFTRTDARADSLLIGALLAWLWTRYSIPVGLVRRFGWVAIAALFVLVFAAGPAASQSFWYYGGFTVFAVVTAVVILAVVDGHAPGTQFFTLRPLTALGRVSYGVYLWHLPIFVAVGYQGRNWPALMRLVVGLGLTAVATALSWRYVEQPASRLRKRFEIRTSEPRSDDLDRHESGMA